MHFTKKKRENEHKIIAGKEVEKHTNMYMGELIHGYKSHVRKCESHIQHMSFGFRVIFALQNQTVSVCYVVVFSLRVFHPYR